MEKTLAQDDELKMYSKIVIKKGIRFYENQNGYIHCKHKNKKLIPVPTMFGNITYVCESCGEVVKNELMPTAL